MPYISPGIIPTPLRNCVHCKSYITLQNYATVYSSYQMDGMTSSSAILLHTHNQITPNPCLYVTSFQSEFLLVKILQHPCSITYFLICTLPDKSGEKIIHILTVSTTDLSLLHLQLSLQTFKSHKHQFGHKVCRSESQTIYCSFDIYYLKMIYL
jgi:hypothetical protein